MTDVAAVGALVEDVAAADSPWMHPMPTAMRAEYYRRGWDGEPPLVFLGEQGGALVAVGELQLPEYDNRRLAWLDVKVSPAHRRHGLGSRMLAHLTDRARSAGRSVLGIDGWENPATEGFAAAHGFERRSQAINRRLYVAGTDASLWAKLVEEAEQPSADYELLRVRGRTPEELLDQVVDITAAINDAPTDDLDWEDEVYTAERLRAYEDANEAKGLRTYQIYARHRPTGRLAGKTVVTVESGRPALGSQEDTSVVAAHRGHRLGLRLKAAMLVWLAESEPQLAEIDTWNAESNTHMVAINERLGYVVLGRALEFQRSW